MKLNTVGYLGLGFIAIDFVLILASSIKPTWLMFPLIYGIGALLLGVNGLYTKSAALKLISAVIFIIAILNWIYITKFIFAPGV